MTRLLERIRARLVDNLHTVLRLFSVQLHLAAVAIAAVYALMPTLDPAIAAMLPAPLQAKAIGGYAILGLAARLIKQRPTDG